MARRHFREHRLRAPAEHTRSRSPPRTVSVLTPPRSSPSRSTRGPKITSPAGTTFTAGQAGTFTVTSAGAPTCALSETGTLPSGVTFKDNGNGTATLVGNTGCDHRPARTRSRSPPRTVSVLPPPRPSPSRSTRRARSPALPPTTFTVGQAGTFTVTSTGTPTCALSETAAACRRGSRSRTTRTARRHSREHRPPPASYLFTITATNGVGAAATQAFTLTVIRRAAQITSADRPRTLPSARPGPLPSRRPGTPTCAICPRRAHCRRESRSRTTGTARRHLREHRLRDTGGTYTLTITATNGVES